MPLVFVYGTLMRERANNPVMRRLGCRFVSTALTQDPRVLVDLGPYPALLARVGTESVRVAGEIWELDEAALDELDAFEGCPDLYSRERVTLETEGARTVEAFVYVLAGPAPADARVIATGRYEGLGTVLPNGAAAEPPKNR